MGGVGVELGGGVWRCLEVWGVGCRCGGVGVSEDVWVCGVGVYGSVACMGEGCLGEGCVSEWGGLVGGRGVCGLSGCMG